MTFTANKSYNNQATNANVGTWGIVLNSNYSIIDLNMGGRLSPNVAGSSNFTVSSTQAQNAFHLITGALTGNIQYILPAIGGFYWLQNNTSGAFTLTATVAGAASVTGENSTVIPQGKEMLVFVNPDNFSVNASYQNVYSCGTAGGSANALTVTTIPNLNIVPAAGDIFIVKFSNNGTSSATIAVNDQSAVAIQKNSAGGTVALIGAEMISGNTGVFIFDGTHYILTNPATLSGALLGTTTNDNAPAGYVGEYFQNIVLVGAAIPLTLNTAVAVASIPLTAGDWDLNGFAEYTGNAATLVTGIQAAIGSVSATIARAGDGSYNGYGQPSSLMFSQNQDRTLPVGPLRVSISSPATYYLNAVATFTANTCSVYGSLRARRVR